MATDDEFKRVFGRAKMIGTVAPLAMLGAGLLLVIVLLPKMIDSPEWRTPVPVVAGLLFVFLGIVGIFYRFAAARTDR